MSPFELFLGAIIGGAVCVAYLVGGGKFGRSGASNRQDATRVAVRKTPIELSYRNADGLKSALRTTIIKVQLYTDGRLSLLGLCGAKKKMREFRADRIEALASSTGESVDLATFLTQRLNIPTDVVAAALRNRPSAAGIAQPRAKIGT